MTEKTQQILIISILIISVTYLIVSHSNIFTNTGKNMKNGVQLNVDKPHFEYKNIKEYHEYGISIGNIEGGVNLGDGTTNNTYVKVENKS